jgi:hypothetical protein
VAWQSLREPGIDFVRLRHVAAIDEGVRSEIHAGLRNEIVHVPADALEAAQRSQVMVELIEDRAAEIELPAGRVAGRSAWPRRRQSRLG